MSQKHCARGWQAEALEDGQLVGAERASFERHAVTCVYCQNELAAFTELGEILSQLPAPKSAPIAHRRARIALLDRASAGTSVTGSRPQRWLALAGVCVALFATLFGARRLLVTTPAAPPFPAVVVFSAPAFDVTDLDHAAWTRESEGTVMRTALKDGVAAFHVEHLATGQRFLLALPDGQIEVRGTRFVVNVREGRTMSVDVTEGAVALHLSGEPDRLLRAGDAWSRHDVTPAARRGPSEIEEAPASDSAKLAVKVARSAPPAPAPSPGPAAPLASALPVSGPVGETGEHPLRSAAPARRERTVANERFAAAAEAFRAGAYAHADVLLARFAREFPSDAQQEDAAFLRAVVHSRMDDRDGAASLARAYLQSYPRGLRRHEAEQLAGEGASLPRAGSLR